MVVTNKSIKKICLAIITFLCVMILMSGCEFNVAIQLEQPVITLNQTSNTIEWEAVENAYSYRIYIDDEYVTYIKADDKTLFEFNFSSYTFGLEDFKICVKAVSNSLTYSNSEFSNTLNASGFVVELNKTNVENIQYDNDLSIQNLSLDKDILSWDKYEKDDFDNYVIAVYYDINNISYYSCNDNKIELNNLVPYDCIASVKVGVELVGGDTAILNTKNFYYNQADFGQFTTNIFAFDGYLNDYYITDYDQLERMHHHEFINRNEDYTFRVAESFSSTYMLEYNNSAAISNCYSETSSMYIKQGENDVYLITRDIKNYPNDYVYNVECEFTEENPQPVLNEYTQNGQKMYKGISNPSVQQHESFTPFYQITELQDRADDYSDFAIENQFVSTQVTSSEQLYWAVEGGFNPIPTPGSRADVIYDKAKAILNEIIKQDMTDYQKTLSIFDYIILNTNYDYNALQNSSLGNNESPMKYTCYYLEGLFLDSNKTVVCDGFSKAFSLLCNIEGIETIRVTGQAGSGASTGGHAWNKVKVDDAWYIVDITWSETKIEQTGIDDEISAHKYFLVDDDSIKYTHHASNNRNHYDNECPEVYDYYANQTYTFDGQTHNLFIESEDEFANVIKYMEQNDVLLDLLFEQSYYNENQNDIFPDDVTGGLVVSLFTGQTIYGIESYNFSEQTGYIIYCTTNYFIDTNFCDLDTIIEQRLDGNVLAFDEIVSDRFMTSQGFTSLNELKTYIQNYLIDNNLNFEIDLIENIENTTLNVNSTLLTSKRLKFTFSPIESM